MAKNSIEPQAAPEEVIESAISGSEKFIMENGKKLLTLLVAVVVVVGGFFAYKYLVTVPRQQKASEMMFTAQQAFALDSMAIALNGDGVNAGFLDVINSYGSTPEGNIANHYAGVCYLKLGQYEKAIASLSAYNAVSGTAAGIINAQNAGLQGDAYVQLSNLNKAISMYEKAIAVDDNALTAPYYLFKMGTIYKKLGNNAKALESYKRIRNEYPGSMEAQNVDRYIGQLEQL